MLKPTTLFTLIILTLTTVAFAQQDKSKRPSPPAQAQCQFPDGKAIKTDYSSPRINDPKTHQPRKIYGGLVPYGKVWRTGANDATTLVTDTNLTVGGKDLPAGSYTVFTVPNQDKWTLVISKKTGEWGTDYPGESNDLARVDMKVSQLPSTMENFTIAFDQTGGNCTMNLDWENTRASVEFAEKK
jgi:hypothetical protein